MGQQLWLNTLSDLTPEQIVTGAYQAIKQSSYLPSPHLVRQCSQPNPEALGLPSVRSAYTEACLAPTPKTEHPWSHPAVYLAGQATDWYVLTHATEAQSFPIFERHYETLCERVLKGEELSLPLPQALEETLDTPMSIKERQKQLSSLRKQLKL